MKQPDGKTSDSPRTKPVTSKPEAIKWRRQYAFCKYDMFPYLIGGEIADWKTDGRVELVNYGHGYWFHPVKILPLAAGLALMENIEALSVAKRDAEKEFHKMWDERLRMLFDLALLGRGGKER